MLSLLDTHVPGLALDIQVPLLDTHVPALALDIHATSFLFEHAVSDFTTV
jgi:hypothetical protein